MTAAAVLAVMPPPATLHADAARPAALKILSVKRSAGNPLITPASSATLGDNINGPSVIRVPSWIKSPLGKYYLYFAHHGGDHVRLAYADSLEGPWKIHPPGTLRLSEAKAFTGHIASPDVHVDEEKREIRMYFHGPVRNRDEQWTGVARSQDGLRFEVSGEILGKSYFRVFKWRGYYYAIAKNWGSGWGELLRSKDGLTPFERRGNFIHGMRHAAVLLRDNRLVVFYSRTGDAPEHILAATVDLTGDWKDWTDSAPVDVILPETDYEGIGFPNEASRHGRATGVRQLRDPFVFEEAGKTFLFYSVAGESGIAMAELKFSLPKMPPPRVVTR